MKKVFAMGRLKRVLDTFNVSENKITKLDKSLLKGFYIKKRFAVP
jgi:hypothetical protein